MDRVHLLKHVKVAKNTEEYGLAFIKEAQEKNLEADLSQDIEAVVYYYIAYQYQKEKNWEEAIAYFQKCHDIRIQRGDNLKYSFLHFVDLYLEKGDWANFEKYTDSTAQLEKHSFYLYVIYKKAFPILFQAKNYKKAAYFFELIIQYFGQHKEEKEWSQHIFSNNASDWDQYDFFYRELYISVYNQGTLEEQHYWVNRWVEMANKYIDAEQARKILRWVINDLSRLKNYTKAAYYAQSLINFERKQQESDKLNYILGNLHYALRLKCYKLMSANQLTEVIDAYI